jgi:hypothetical protein
MAAGAAELTIALAKGVLRMNSLNIMKFGFRFVAAVVALLLAAVPLFSQASVGGLAGNLSGKQTQKLAELRRFEHHSTPAQRLDIPKVVFSSIDAFLRGKWPAEAEKVTALDGIGKKGGDQLEIRIANRSRVAIENVRVQFPSQTEVYGTIPPNGVTDYRVVKKAYRYAPIKAVVSGVPAGFQPIDYVGESELKAGRYTYVLTIHPRATPKYYGLKLKLRKE